MIYFARQIGTVGPIKIGFSRDVKRRISEISCRMGIKAELIVEAPGELDVEKRLHLKFLDDQIPLASGIAGKSEWFNASEKLLRYIEQVKLTGVVNVSDVKTNQDLFIEEYLSGMTIDQIAKKFSASQSWVWVVLSRNDILPVKPPLEIVPIIPSGKPSRSISELQKMTPKQVEDAAVKARVSVADFLRNAGVSPSAFYRWRNAEHALRPLTLAKLADAVEAV